MKTTLLLYAGVAIIALTVTGKDQENDLQKDYAYLGQKGGRSGDQTPTNFAGLSIEEDITEDDVDIDRIYFESTTISIASPTPDICSTFQLGCLTNSNVERKHVTCHGKDIGSTVTYGNHYFTVVNRKMLQQLVSDDVTYISKVCVSNIHDMSYIFDGKDLNHPSMQNYLCWLDLSYAKDTQYLYFNATFPPNFDASCQDLQRAIDVSFMFANSNLGEQGPTSSRRRQIILMRINTRSAYYMTGLFRNAKRLGNVNMEIATENVRFLSSMLDGCVNFNGRVTSIGKTTFDIPYAVNNDFMMRGCASFDQILSITNTFNLVSATGAFQNMALFTGDGLQNMETQNLQHIHAMFAGSCSISASYSKWNLLNVNDSTGSFYCTNLENQYLSDEAKMSPPSLYILEAASIDIIVKQKSVLKPPLTLTSTTTPSSTSSRQIIKVSCPKSAHTVGQNFSINNQQYRVVDKHMLQQIINNASDWHQLEFVCTTQVTDMNSFFGGVTSAPKTKANISRWDTSQVVDMSYMFSEFNFSSHFVGDISTWDTSLVTNMQGMFRNAKSFNTDISRWNTSSVSSMNSMFSLFDFSDGFIGNNLTWDTSNVYNMHGMFRNAKSFNTDISMWDTSSVSDMSWVFQNITFADGFNLNISNWNTKSVDTMRGMFKDASSFNQPLNWNTASVTIMAYTFKNASKFNQPLNWDTSSVTDMRGMFEDASKFNQPLNWDTSSVTDMSNMFHKASLFNRPLNWNTSQVNNMYNMFRDAYSFNQNITAWDVTHVTDMEFMMYNASSYTGGWNWGLLSNKTTYCGNWCSSNMNNCDPKMFHSFRCGYKPVTCPKPAYAAGQNVSLNNQQYRVVDKYMLQQIINNESNWYQLENVCTTQVTDMNSLFKHVKVATDTKADISGWDTSQVVDMSYMFSEFDFASHLVGDISTWNTLSVTNMESMFSNSEFNQNIRKWNTSSVTNVASMFQGATSFNRNIDNWTLSQYFESSDVSCGNFADSLTFKQNYWPIKVQNLSCGAKSIVTCAGYEIGKNYTWPLNNQVYTVVDKKMLQSFAKEEKTWNRLEHVCTTLVTNMSFLFFEKYKFNKNISTWDTSSVTNMESMFEGMFKNSDFNQDIGDWDTSSVTNMEGMFSESEFNQDIGDWDTSSVINMEGMFKHNNKFNQNIGKWNTSSVINMMNMFDWAFNQDISHWIVKKVTNCDCLGFLDFSPNFNVECVFHYYLCF